MREGMPEFRIGWFILAVALAGCAIGPPASVVPTGTPTLAIFGTPSPAPAQSPAPMPLSAAAARYILIDRFGAVGAEAGIFYCDPDQYPIARADSRDRGIARFSEIQKDAVTLDAILNRLGFGDPATLTPEQKYAVHVEDNKLRAISIQPEPSAAFRFVLSRRVGASGEQIEGTLDAFGAVKISSQIPARLSCPICLPAGARIDTPNGPRAVETLRPGDVVWTPDGQGRPTAAPLIRIGRAFAPPNHQFITLTLSDGRRVTASPGHPTADGRLLGTLGNGAALDGARVIRVDWIAGGEGETFDILPAGETGAYWSDGVLLGSTLR